MTSPVFESVRLDDVLLEPDPIDPAWILEGNPVARSGRCHGGGRDGVRPKCRNTRTVAGTPWNVADDRVDQRMQCRHARR